MKPEFIKYPTSKLAVVEGRTVELVYAVQADPKAEFDWLKDGQQILPGSRYSPLPLVNQCKLRILKASTHDSGNITCIAHNSNGQTVCSVQLTVLEEEETTPRHNQFQALLRATAKPAPIPEIENDNEDNHSNDTKANNVWQSGLRSVATTAVDQQEVSSVIENTELSCKFRDFFFRSSNSSSSSRNSSADSVIDYMTSLSSTANNMPTAELERDNADATPPAKTDLPSAVNPFQYWIRKEADVKEELRSLVIRGPCPRQHHLSICIRCPSVVIPLDEAESETADTFDDDRTTNDDINGVSLDQTTSTNKISNQEANHSDTATPVISTTTTTRDPQQEDDQLHPFQPKQQELVTKTDNLVTCPTEEVEEFPDPLVHLLSPNWELNEPVPGIVITNPPTIHDEAGPATPLATEVVNGDCKTDMVDASDTNHVNVNVQERVEPRAPQSIQSRRGQYSRALSTGVIDAPRNLDHNGGGGKERRGGGEDVENLYLDTCMSTPGEFRTSKFNWFPSSPTDYQVPFPKSDAEIQMNIDPNPLFEWFEQVGSGRFGKVFRCSEKQNPSMVLAGKFIRYRRADRDDVVREVEIMRRVSHHAQVMSLHSVYDLGRRMVIVMEFVSGGELFDRIASEEQLTEDQAANFVRQILCGLDFIHSKNIIHRDLKPENILCKSADSYDIKIIDFGLADFYDSKKPPKRMVGTTLFVAPEVLQFDPQSYQTDIWSLGVITYDLLAGITPFEIPQEGDLDRALTDNEILVNIERCQYTFEEHGFASTSELAKDFIRRILVKKPGLRPNASQCLKHDWFKEQIKERKVPRLVSIQRMKQFVASRKWNKVQLALRACAQLKGLTKLGVNPAISAVP